MMQFIVRVDGPAYGYRYALINMNTARSFPVGDVYEGLKTSFETRRITYEAADGLKIPAYLTLPAGRPATKLPLIVLPHGGPAARDSLDFDWWAQALASQGYAVLKPNYRGSLTTHSFVTAGYGEWGGKCRLTSPMESDTWQSKGRSTRTRRYRRRQLWWLCGPRRRNARPRCLPLRRRSSRSVGSEALCAVGE